MSQSAVQPNPGSAKAIKTGCTCPIIGNRRGRGAYVDENGQPQFWISEDCPLHGQDEKTPEKGAAHGHN